MPAPIAHKLTTGRGGEGGRANIVFISKPVLAFKDSLICFFLLLVSRVSTSSVNPAKTRLFRLEIAVCLCVRI